VTVGRLVGRGW